MFVAGKGKKAEKEKKVKTERAGTRRLGVSGKLILNMAIPTGVILTLLTIILVAVTTTTIHGLKNKDIETQLEDVSEQVEQYFEPYFVSEAFISGQTSVKQILGEMQREPSTYRFETSEYYREALKDLEQAASISGDAVQGVWLAGVKTASTCSPTAT